MAESRTVARPYAEAAYDFAREEKDVAGWSGLLSRLNAIVQAPEAAALIDNPRLPAHVIADTIAGTAGSLTAPQKNFVHLLVENGRLEVIDEIARQFESHRLAGDGTLEVQISSAFALADDQVQEIVKTLEARFGRKVKPAVQVEPELIGGVCLRMGDEVIDASVRGKLARLAVTLKS